MKIYKVAMDNRVAMGKEHDELQGYINDQPEESVNDILNQIMGDIRGYYDGTGSSSFRTRYALQQPHNDFIRGYYVEVLAMASNNGTNFGDASTHYMELRMFSRDRMDESQYIEHINKLEKMIKGTLWHEMGHYYITQKRGKSEELLYYQQGMDKYFDDKEELVLHSRDTWKKIVNQYPNIYEIPPDRIKMIVSRYVARLPQDIGFHGVRFPKALQAKYANFIWKHYVKPNLG